MAESAVCCQRDTAMQAEDDKTTKRRGNLSLRNAAEMVRVAFSSVRRRRGAVERAVKKTDLTGPELEKAQLMGLTLPTEDCECVHFDKTVLDRQMNIIANLVLPLDKRRTLRKYILDEMFDHLKEKSIYTKVGLRRKWVKVKSKLGELVEVMSLWTGDLKTIEGLFGGGVLMYFSFLRWLFAVNIVIFLLMFFFITIPQFAFPDDMAKSNWTDFSSRNIKRADKCSASYVVEGPDNPGGTQPFIDFLQGTGWMEKKIVFYGAYKDNRVLLSRSYSYNLPLAYILVVLSYFLLSLVLVVRQTANGVRDRLVGMEFNLHPYCRLAFTFWDYSISDQNSSTTLHRSIKRENEDLLKERKRTAQMRAMVPKMKVRLWARRIFINIVVIGILSIACYVIFLVVTTSIKVKNERNYKNKTPFEQLSLTFMVSLTITALNFFVPIVFTQMVTFENYSFAVEVNFTLIRTVVLKLASLVVLVYTIYNDVNCSPKDECNVGTGDCSELRCWETRVGQEFYRLVLVDAFAVTAIVLLIEFPRKLFVTHVKGCIPEMIGLPEFDIPKNILDLIYTEVLVWFGTFFSPMIPLMTVLELVLVFHLKKWSLLYNFTPSSKTYRAADSNFFVQIVLLGAYVVCITPIMYVIWSMSPSTGCGPFRSYDYMYHTLSATIQGWPRWLKGIADFLVSPAFSIPAFFTLLLIIYYMRKMMNTYEQMNNILRTQLFLEKNGKKIVVESIQSTKQPGGQQQTDASSTPPFRSEPTNELTTVSEV